ncbi:MULTISPECIES: hypothetical protein [unclassified Mesorhizobium]|uniref:hypothetical protein n=1 Tax=unclassified Mesorhizobium TaxID=325217 RepID=UPI00086C1F73|nr:MULTISPECIES: hypothetical protein [unclassified Mesorhizobium]MBN9253193.1 hypothetical protein [Mesorhizobium sp.]ODT13643.1 MAG: hypothetical protein ABS57_17935 [Mesorhizobium sp. SCN 65-12]OJX82333.1 MAG: hypothetical protein BGO93_24375 [Mesorhizobium sp. 65-26]
MSALLSFLVSNPTILAAGAGIVAALTAWMHGRISGARAQAGADRAREADSYEKYLQELGKAAAAGGAVRPGDSLSDDPFNRDR